MKSAGNSSNNPQDRLKRVLPKASAERLRVAPASMIHATAISTFSKKLFSLFHQAILTFTPSNTTTLSSYESSKMTVLQIGQMPLYSIKHFWINRRTAGKVNPEVFFIAHPFQ